MKVRPKRQQWIFAIDPHPSTTHRHADAADLIKNILVLDPLRRLPLKSILAHPFFTRDPPPQESHLFRRDASPHMLPEAFPPVIFEESSLSELPPLDDPAHPLHASDVSDSYFSASGSSLDGRRSGATTPITSDDGSSQSKGKERAIDQDDDGGSADQLGLLQRNESQTTLRHEHGTPRGRKLLMPEEGEEHQGQSNTSAYQAYLLSAPSLRRTMSTSSGQSFTSTGGSPVPAHARTPSRTKRRSVGSTFSERLLPVDEEHHLPTPDFLALLATPPAPPLSTAEDVALLDSLTTLGFDAGQIRHSITTNACDSAAAVWWMLKRKADDRERDRIEAETLGGGTPVGTTSKTHSRQSSIRRRPSTYSQKTPEKEIYEEEEEEGSAPTRPMTRSPVPEEGLAIKGAFDPEDGNEERSAVPVTPGGRPRRAGDDECLPFFLHQPTAGTMSAPNLDFFPLIDPGSPSRKPMPRSKSKDYLSLSPSPSPSQLPPPVPSPPESPESKSKRARSGSVNMLVRATAALGSGLQLKKSTDGVKDEDDSVRSSSPSGGLFRRKSSIPDEPLLKDRPLSAPSSPPQPQSSPLKQDATKTPSRSPAPAPPPPLPPLLDPSPPMSHSGSHDTFDTVTSSTSSAAVPRPASIRRSNIPSASNTPGSSGKKSSKGANLFSNFRHWFGDGPRKRNNSKRNSSSGAASVSEGPPLARSSSLSRRNNLRQEISPSAFVGSPLKRPPLGSRRSSNGSIVGGVGAPISRRGSINSIHRPKLSTEGTPGGSAGGYHHRRRYSDASRASEPDRENLSRPGSLRSFSGQHRSNRSSSHGTGHHPSSVSPKDVIRRPPTTTVVRRRHGSHGRHGSHSRNRSTSSANTRHSSSSEQGEEEILTLLAEDEDEVAGTGGQAAILEEDENAALETTPTLEGTESDAEGERKEQERERALRTLSGDWSAIAPRVDDQGTHKTTSDAHVPHKSHSRLSLDSATSSRSHHSTTFTAHKTVHLFGAPSQPAPSSISRHKTSLSLSRPALRDVFANKEEDDNGWEDDNGDGYGGGLGQESTRSGAGASAGAGSFESSMPAMGGGAGDSPVASKLFDGRYGGRGPNEAIGGRVGVGAPNAGAGRMAVAIVEEEEEEEE